jgi:hypothetical protein
MQQIPVRVQRNHGCELATMHVGRMRVLQITRTRWLAAFGSDDLVDCIRPELTLRHGIVNLRVDIPHSSRSHLETVYLRLTAAAAQVKTMRKASRLSRVVSQINRVTRLGSNACRET